MDASARRASPAVGHRRRHDNGGRSGGWLSARLSRTLRRPEAGTEGDSHNRAGGAALPRPAPAGRASSPPSTAGACRSRSPTPSCSSTTCTPVLARRHGSRRRPRSQPVPAHRPGDRRELRRARRSTGRRPWPRSGTRRPWPRPWSRPASPRRRTWVGSPAQLAASIEPAAYPLVVKPIFGDNGLGVRLVAGPEDLPDQRCRPPGPPRPAVRPGRRHRREGLRRRAHRHWAVRVPVALRRPGARHG